MGIFRKIPHWPALASVYAVLAVFVYGWTIYWFLWKLPSWIYYLTMPEILTIAAYSAAVNFLESLLLLSLPLFLSVFLPKSWVYENFISVGGFLGIMVGGFLLYFSSISAAADTFSYSLIWPAILFLVISICLAIFLGRLRMIAQVVETIADRLKVFLYILIPVSLLSILLVAIRNLIR
ncbi:MAG: hypothetical protein K8S20_16095 [Chloroflexi bacterium]|nr:hypothetical protein [Chloroflexota bacterium]